MNEPVASRFVPPAAREIPIGCAHAELAASLPRLLAELKGSAP
jgi:hypothetical protein